MDLEATLTTLLRLAQKHDQAEKKTRAQISSSLLEDAERYEKAITRAQKWGGWIWGVISILAAIFAAGVSYAVFMGENATDDEVEKAVHEEMTDHNGGVHPETIDPSTHAPVGDHPDIREAVHGVEGKVSELNRQADRMEKTQRKLDKRSEFQFELGRWEAESMEAERKRRPRPPKPERLKKLESDLMMGKYD